MHSGINGGRYAIQHRDTVRPGEGEKACGRAYTYGVRGRGRRCGGGDAMMPKDNERTRNHEMVQTFVIIKKESRGKDNSNKRTEIK